MDTKDFLTRQFDEALKSIDTDNYISIVSSAMELVERSIHSSGKEKEEFVVELVSAYVEKSDSGLLKTILSETTIRNLISVLIAVSKGVIHLQPVKTCFKMFPGC